MLPVIDFCRLYVIGPFSQTWVAMLRLQLSKILFLVIYYIEYIPNPVTNKIINSSSN